MDRTPFLPRLAAFLLDLGVFAAAVHLFTAVDVLLNVFTPLNNFGVVSLLGGSVLLVGYGALEVFLAGTPGKRLCGLMIAAEDGRPPARSALVKRWAVKHCPVFFAAPMLGLWTLLSPHNYHFPLPPFVAVGVLALAVTDTVVTAVLLLMVIGGCFLALRRDRQTLHDAIARTAVFPRAEVLATAAFRPVVAIPVGDGDEPAPRE